MLVSIASFVAWWFRKKLCYAACGTVIENNFCKNRIKVYLLSEASDNKGR
ncbi:MAG: hypothetical protein LWX51_17260 [Deltaproteobacteria bacterium]|nr:hypothetical protein [Deltaproteobacteria bacterium]